MRLIIIKIDATVQLLLFAFLIESKEDLSNSEKVGIIIVLLHEKG